MHSISWVGAAEPSLVSRKQTVTVQMFNKNKPYCHRCVHFNKCRISTGICTLLALFNGITVHLWRGSTGMLLVWFTRCLLPLCVMWNSELPQIAMAEATFCEAPSDYENENPLTSGGINNTYGKTLLTRLWWQFQNLATFTRRSVITVRFVYTRTVPERTEKESSLASAAK